MDNPTIFSEMWNEYRRVILHSIITSFGLDFVVRDQDGGDVDTILSVRKTEQYKNPQNAVAYKDRGVYDKDAYHHNVVYDSIVRKAKNSHEFMDDAYVPGHRIYYGKASALGTEKKANLDHVISAKEVHDDRGRVLADLDGVVLANTPSNLQFTNQQLNDSMGDKSIEEYIRWREDKGDPLPDAVITQMREKDSAARKEYDRRINEAYYTSERFFRDAGAAAAKRGIEMGLRQALGFVFIEIWCACEDEIKALLPGIEFVDCARAVVRGIQKGIENTKTKYKELFAQLEQGFTAGALASLTTTLINAFVLTDKKTIRYIRQGYVTVVQVGNILLLNPDDLLLGDQLKAATVSLTTGASIIAGTAVGNAISETPIGQNKEVGAVVQNFCSALVSGLISCTLLIMIDRSAFIIELVKRLNAYGPADHELKETSDAFIRIAAEIAQYDISEFSENVYKLDDYSKRILRADDDELHGVLMETLEAFNIPLPWTGDFDSFMGNGTNRLVFE